MSQPNPYETPEDWRRPSADVRRLVATCDALADVKWRRLYLETLQICDDAMMAAGVAAAGPAAGIRLIVEQRDEWKLRAQNAEDVARLRVDAERERDEALAAAVRAERASDTQAIQAFNEMREERNAWMARAEKAEALAARNSDEANTLSDWFVAMRSRAEKAEAELAALRAQSFTIRAYYAGCECRPRGWAEATGVTIADLVDGESVAHMRELNLGVEATYGIDSDLSGLAQREAHDTQAPEE